MAAHQTVTDDIDPTIAIIGGGFSGAALAYHLTLRQTPARIVVFEPRDRLGAGLAYDTNEPTNRINVPADRMSLIPGDDGHFARWVTHTEAIADDPAARLADGRIFPRRTLFGDYVDQHIRPLVEAGQIVHERQRVTSIRRNGTGWRIEAEGSQLCATHVVIATTHPPPSPPRELAALIADRRLVPDPLRPGWADDIKKDDRLLIVGTGLTMADTISALDRRGHRGQIVAISRRGLRSRAHGVAGLSPFGDFSSNPAPTARQLLRAIRDRLAEAAAAGLDWHPVIDGVRTQGRTIWLSLPVTERRRVVRWLRPYWDVHRFRIAPTVNAVIDRAIAEGRLEIRAARLVSAEAHPTGLQVTSKAKSTGALHQETYDRVVLTTGPGHRDILRYQPALNELHGAGLLHLDQVGLGIACDHLARCLDEHGSPVPGLYIAGPLARGTFGELMGLPQVSEFALNLSQILHESLTAPAKRR